MSVTVTACYLVNIIIDIVLIFLISINVIEFDEIKTSKKNPVAQCNLLNPLVMISTIEGGIVNGCLMVLMLQVLPEYCLHCVSSILFLLLTDWLSCIINFPLLAYHIYR